MKVRTFILHAKESIYSFDVDWIGYRLITGGQDNRDGSNIVIWNMIEISNLTNWQDVDLSKFILNQLKAHTGCVNCVRFSINGQMIASAGDDKCVMIWKLINNTNILNNNTNESWTVVHSLRTHHSDVSEVAWSPTMQYFASASVDNSIIIYNVNDNFKVVRELKEHAGLVKGICWDPFGEFLASHSDDNTMRIWKCRSFDCVSCISRPFQSNKPLTYMLRCDWSASGRFILTGNSNTTDSIISAKMIKRRRGWTCAAEVIGHQQAICCCKFFPLTIKRRIVQKNKSNFIETDLFALGSSDGTISIWLSCLSKPIVVIEELFSSSVIDLNWSNIFIIPPTKSEKIGKVDTCVDSDEEMENNCEKKNDNDELKDISLQLIVGSLKGILSTILINLEEIDCILELNKEKNLNYYQTLFQNSIKSRIQLKKFENIDGHGLKDILYKEAQMLLKEELIPQSQKLNKTDLELSENLSKKIKLKRQKSDISQSSKKNGSVNENVQNKNISMTKDDRDDNEEIFGHKIVDISNSRKETVFRHNRFFIKTENEKEREEILKKISYNENDLGKFNNDKELYIHRLIDEYKHREEMAKYFVGEEMKEEKKKEEKLTMKDMEDMIRAQVMKRNKEITESTIESNVEDSLKRKEMLEDIKKTYNRFSDAYLLSLS
ncbi:hypothetical protein SNEBB_004614 [Seison nebaliae]|nr:hypothetical protein SNEBB_004614 [Seison nebaliae]